MRLARRLSMGVLGLLALPAPVTQAASQDNNVEWDGVFSDTTANYVSPMEFSAGATITIRLRARASDLTAAVCRIYFSGPGTIQRVSMTKSTSGSIFDVWSASVTVPSSATALYYRFELTDGSDTDYLDAGDKSDAWNIRGMTDAGREERDFMLLPGFSTPEWSRKAVYYQIFPDRFFDGNSSNNLVFPDDCFWYLDYAPACRDSSCAEFAAQCSQYTVPAVSSGYTKFCEIQDDWSASPNGGPCDFFGGDLSGITAKLDYIEGLNATSIYLNPIFRSMSNHKYDTMDYDTVDPRFGGNAALSDLTKAATTRGMKIIGDGVFNHGSDLGKFYNGWGNYAWNSSASSASGYDYYSSSCGGWEELYLSTQANNWTDCSSTYSDWFKIWTGTDVYDVDRDGNTSEPSAHTCGWAGLEFMPDFDYKSPASPNSETRTWLYGGGSASQSSAAKNSVAGKWLADGGQLQDGMDGWRLDVPDNAGYFNNTNTGDCSKTSNDASIWQGFRTAVKTVGTDRLVIGEIWNDASSSNGVNWFTARTYDGVMNYHYFGMPVSCFITGVGVHDDANECQGDYAALSLSSSTSIDSLDAHLANERRVYPASAYMSSQNLLSSHDTSRFRSRADGSFEKMKVAVSLQATLPGAPMIYYGDELGVLGANNEQGRAPFPWDTLTNTGSDEVQLKEFTESLMCIRRAYASLSTGSFYTLWTHNDQRTYAYGRADSESQIAVLINNSSSTRTVSPQLFRLGLTDGTAVEDVLTGTGYTVTGGAVSVSVPAYGTAILVPTALATPAIGCLQAPNTAPTANAGADQSICPDEQAILDGSASSDADGDGLTYAWYDSNNTLVSQEVVYTVSGLSAGTYTYKLTVSDGQDSSSDSVQVVVKSESQCGGSGGCKQSSSPLRQYGLFVPITLVGYLISRRRRQV